MGVLFSTQDLRASERFDYWHQLVYRTYAPCIGSVEALDRFSACLNVVEFGPTEISDVTSTSIRYERRNYDVRCGPRDDLFVSFMVHGQTRFTQNDCELLQNEGDVLVYDSARPYLYQYDGGYRSLLLRIPRPAFEARMVEVDRLGGRLFPSNSPFGRLVGSLIRESRKIALSSDAMDVSEFTTAMLDMISAAIRQGTSDEIPSSSGSRALFDRIKRYMRDNLADSTLTLERISKEQNVSVRTLSRLFAEAGTTPMSWLQGQRLACAHSALAERKVRNVTEAAFTFGFNDLSHFGRTFKRMYGYTPNSLLSERMS